MSLTCLLEDSFELLLEVLECLLGFLDSDVTATDEGLGVVLTHRTLGVDDRVHPRLGE